MPGPPQAGESDRRAKTRTGWREQHCCRSKLTSQLCRKWNRRIEMFALFDARIVFLNFLTKPLLRSLLIDQWSRR
jgi:hypothetical protein